MDKTKKWWHDKVAYQIYPKSFCDSNGDGIGDLQGIIGKLDYLKELGVDIVWLSPIFCSPLADQGYDISDYYNIDPRFGTMADMDELIAEAKKRDMRILMDLVVNHCSDEHEWFQKACEDPDGKYGKYFYIVDAPKDGSLPTNWRSYFGGSVWEKLPGHEDKLYLHVFHKKQPDLNWENPEVREEVYQMVNWWLDKGLGGFRIDAIINIKKAAVFRDYPADRADGLTAIQNMLHEAQGIGVFLSELRDKTFKPHDSFAVGEVFDVKEALSEVIGEEGWFSSMFDFGTTMIGARREGWHKRQPVTAKQYIQALFGSQTALGDVGFYSNIIENHDEPRGVSHYLPEGECTEAGKKMLALIEFMVRGLPFIYQGQEIGMENMPFSSIDQVDDCSSLDEYRVAMEAGLSEAEALHVVSRFSRDNARTPMQWNDGENAGFTTGKPWLVVNPNYRQINVEAQKNDPNSVLHFYKKLISLRREERYQDALVYGSLIPVPTEDEQVMMFYRKGETHTLLVIANFQKAEASLPFSGKVLETLIDNLGGLRMQDGKIHLGGYQAAALLVDPESVSKA